MEYELVEGLAGRKWSGTGVRSGWKRCGNLQASGVFKRKSNVGSFSWVSFFQLVAGCNPSNQLVATNWLLVATNWLLVSFFQEVKHVPRVPEEEPDAEKCLCEVVGEPLAQVENESASSAGSRRAACKSRTFIFQRSPDRGESLASGPAHLHARSRDSAAGTR